MAIVLLTLHSARRSVLAIIVQETSQLLLLTLTMALIIVAVSIATTHVLVEVCMEVVVSRAVRPRLVGVVLVNLFLDGVKFIVCRSIRSTPRVPAR
jgi:hypothetical protein